MLQAVVFACAGIALALIVYRVTVDNAAEQRPPDSSAERRLAMSPEVAETAREEEIGEPLTDPVEPARLRAMLDMAEEQQRHVLWLTIKDRNYDCDQVVDSQRLGDSAGAWRAHCGGTSVYWVEVDDFGRLSVDPAVYGDLPGVPVIDRTRTIELEDPER